MTQLAVAGRRRLVARWLLAACLCVAAASCSSDSEAGPDSSSAPSSSAATDVPSGELPMVDSQLLQQLSGPLSRGERPAACDGTPTGTTTTGDQRTTWLLSAPSSNSVDGAVRLDGTSVSIEVVPGSADASPTTTVTLTSADGTVSTLVVPDALTSVATGPDGQIFAIAARVRSPLTLVEIEPDGTIVDRAPLPGDVHVAGELVVTDESTTYVRDLSDGSGSTVLRLGDDGKWEGGTTGGAQTHIAGQEIVWRSSSDGTSTEVTTAAGEPVGTLEASGYGVPAADDSSTAFVVSDPYGQQLVVLTDSGLACVRLTTTPTVVVQVVNGGSGD